MLPAQKKKYDESKKDNMHEHQDKKGRTPLPWKIEERVSQGVFIIAENIPDIYDKTVCIMRWTSPLVSKEAEMADAEFIVSACNSHADLLDALEDIAKGNASIPDDVLIKGRAATTSYMWTYSQERARKAIAKIKGE